MPKKNKKHQEVTRPMEYADEEQVYGVVEKLLGDRFFTVKCIDNKDRRARVRSKRMRIRLQDVVIIALRDFDDKNADIVHVYNSDEVRRLKKEGEIPSDDFTAPEETKENDEVGFDFDEI